MIIFLHFLSFLNFYFYLFIFKWFVYSFLLYFSSSTNYSRWEKGYCRTSSSAFSFCNSHFLLFSLFLLSLVYFWDEWIVRFNWFLVLITFFIRNVFQYVLLLYDWNCLPLNLSIEKKHWVLFTSSFSPSHNQKWTNKKVTKIKNTKIPNNLFELKNR